TKVDGRAVAALYRAIAPGAPESQRVIYESPIGRVVFEQVLDVSKTVALAAHNGNVEWSIPLAVIGLKPAKGMELLGDIGWLRGNGRQTVQRLYWNNFNTVTVSDLPTEARIEPAHWGIWKIE